MKKLSSQSFIFIAGPCVAESLAQIMTAAKTLRKIGVPSESTGSTYTWKS